MSTGENPVVSFIGDVHRRQDAEREAFGKTLRISDYEAILILPESAASMEVSFDAENPSNHEDYPVRTEIAVGQQVTVDLFFRDAEIYLNNIRVIADGRGNGLGRRVLLRIIKNIQQLRKFETVCARAVRFPLREHNPIATDFGYYVIPRWGFDAALTSAQKQALPDPLKGAECLLDLMATDLGRQHWRDVGGTVDAVLTLDPEHRSWKTFIPND